MCNAMCTREFTSHGKQTVHIFPEAVAATVPSMFVSFAFECFCSLFLSQNSFITK